MIGEPTRVGERRDSACRVVRPLNVLPHRTFGTHNAHLSKFGSLLNRIAPVRVPSVHRGLTCVANRRTMRSKLGLEGDKDMALASASTKNDRIDFRVRSDVKQKLQQAAELEGVPLSSFLVQCAVERADEVILRNTRIELSRRDQEALVDELLNPAEPSEGLIEAFRIHSRKSSK